MAAALQPADNSEEFATSLSKISLKNKLFIPEDTLDQPCDLVVVVEDGKEFKAHRKVLSEASSFFEKLLNNDMKESKEGIVRLEMFSELVMAATLEFIYTGHVQILAEDNTRDLIVMADYLFLEKLKTPAEGVLAQKLNTANCISTYHFSERYQCEELLSKTKKFILANFTAVYAANREDVLNMSSKEVEMWISSDEIDVTAEEDVFKFILAWIDHDKNKRQRYFAELFRHVRLVFASRDFLISDVVTNDMVKDNEGCLLLVKDAIDLIDSKNYDNLSVPPRKSLETPAIVMSSGADFVCYFPDEDSWCKVTEIPREYSSFEKCFSCKGKLYLTTRVQWLLNSVNMVNYNPYTKSWMQLPPLENRCLRKTFVGNRDEIWALLAGVCLFCRRVGSCITPSCRNEHGLFISKYKPESNSWEDIASLGHFHPNARRDYCIVASDNFIYFIGGVQFAERQGHVNKYAYLSDVGSYNLSKKRWDKVADIQVARASARGAAANGKIFIAGGRHQDSEWLYHSYEMYDETTNEWQFIASIKKPEAFDTLLAADGKLYAVSCDIQRRADCNLQEISVECYNPEKNEWEMKTERAFPLKKAQARVLVKWRRLRGDNACIMRLFKGLSNIRPLETSTPESLSEATTVEPR